MNPAPASPFTAPASAPSTTPKKKKSKMKWYIIGGVVLIVGLGVAAKFSKKNGDQGTMVTVEKAFVKTITQVVTATGKVLLLHEDTLTGGIGGEIAAWIAEHCFEHLDAPVMRCASLDSPIPFNLELEKNFMAYSRLDEAVEKLMNF